MQQHLVVEASELIDRPAASVWNAVRSWQSLAVPEASIEVARTQSPDGGMPTHVAESGRVSMQQRVVEVDEHLMLLRLEMTSGQNVPWSSCQSRLRFEAVNQLSTRVTLSCLAAATSEPELVEGLLLSLLVSSLKALKQRMEASPK